MQFGIFSVSDITRDPVTGAAPSEGERIDATVQIARRADEVGLDENMTTGSPRSAPQM